MTTTTRFILAGDGKITREDITVRDIRITPDIIQSLSANMTLRIPRVAHHPKWGLTSLCVGSDSLFWWTVEIPKLPLRCAYRMIEGVAVPQLDSDKDPIIALDWVPPKDMRLAFLTSTYMYNPNTVGKYEAAYIFAYAPDKSTWRLPLGNLYDECRICLGKEEFRAPSHLECVTKILEQFEKSDWNADLWTPSKRVKTQQLFRYTPVNEGFNQIPIEPGKWMTLCDKVGLSLTDKVTISE